MKNFFNCISGDFEDEDGLEGVMCIFKAFSFVFILGFIIYLFKNAG